MSMTFTVNNSKQLAKEGKAKRESVNARSREAHAAAADIGSIPPCMNPARRLACGMDLLLFLETYFPYTTGLSPFGPDQIAAIRGIEVGITDSGWVCNVLPRGFVKSTISENSLLWAILYGFRRFGLFFAGTSVLSQIGIRSIAQELTTNELLLEDFPEACYPLIALGGKVQRAASQTYLGETTQIEMTRDTLRLAHVPGYPCSGALVKGFGLLSPPRGVRHKNKAGENVRPDFGIIDDPSTDESARSDIQNESRYNFIYNSISMMGGHGNAISLVMNATIIKEDDLASKISNPDISPEWTSLRVPMVKKMPKTLETLWLGEYARIRQDFDRADPQGRIKAKQASTQFLKDNYDAMHEGALVAWEHIALERYEISPLQHGLNILIDKGPETFFAECQNAPLSPTSASAFEMTEAIRDRKSGYEQRVVPKDSAFLTFGIDVHANLLYYTVVATNQDFSGSIIDYGVWPEQNTTFFTQKSASNTLNKLYGGKNKEDNEVCVERGVAELIYRLMNQRWMTESGDAIAVTCGLVDSGYKREDVRTAIRQMMPQARVVLSSRGIGIGPTKKAMNEYDLSPSRVIRYGPDASNPRWLLPQSDRDGDLFGIQFDVNFWKDVVAARLVQEGPKGKWTLFGDRRTDHSMFVSHLLSEKPDLVSANGRTVSVWSLKNNQDNHFFDCTVMCAVAASLSGAQLPTTVQKQPIAPATIVNTLKNRDDFGDFFASAR